MASTSTDNAKTKTDDSLSMKMVCLGIRKKFHRVDQLTTQQLAEWFAEGREVTLLVSSRVLQYCCHIPMLPLSST